ncbi:BTB domain-containing protein [Favolaschia claudopus]|uniref:BTB domain-containing protein n=1 Tax=Favolaschia claudopus TaxID=2862362 RepID=A0AAW0DQW0_9AGAR
MAQFLSDGPPIKRQRPDDEEEPPITRSETWHADGSVVLLAERTQFRVHWSVLCKNSAFFQEMQSLPQPPSQDKIEGCPIVELHDSAVDVQHLLDVLYDPLLFSEQKHPLPFIAAIIRLGRKYDFKNLLAAAVQRLTFENPSTLEEYGQLTMKDDKSIAYTPTKYHSHIGMNFDIIDCSREWSIHPAPMRLSSHIDAILNGLNGPQGHIILSTEQQHILLTAHRKIIDAQWSHPELWLWLGSDSSSADGCTTIAQGNSSCAQRKKLVFRQLLVRNYSLVPFRMPGRQKFLCDPCNRCHVKIMANARKKLWDDLPTFFGLPQWADLKNDL